MLRLKELRTKAKLSQQDVASKLGITQQAYANYESGKREPDNRSLILLATIFGVSVDYILGVEDVKKEPATEYSDGEKEIYEIMSQLTEENQRKLVELARLYVESQERNKDTK